MSQSVVSRLAQAEIQGSNTPVSKLTVAVDTFQSVRERLAKLSGGVFRLPLPADVDPEFSIRIAVGGVHGFQLSHCAKTIEDADGDPTGAADATILEVVDKANLVLDTLYPAMNVGKVIVQRGMVSILLSPPFSIGIKMSNSYQYSCMLRIHRLLCGWSRRPRRID